MLSIKKCPIPPNTLLIKYSGNGTYTDCYCTEVVGAVPFPEFIFAFYTTALFKLERWILAWTVARPSTDKQVRELANRVGNTFAAWHVEERRENEILMCDLLGRTRSWLMTAPVDDSRTRLYFGSAVVPVQNPRTGKVSLGPIYQSLLGFHQIYSALLLYSAKQRIQHIQVLIGR